MTRQYIKDFGQREQIEQAFLVTDKQLRANRNGQHYLQLKLADKTGSIVAMLWNAGQTQYQSFEIGDYLDVTGATQVHNGSLQIIATKIRSVDKESVNEEEFLAKPPVDVEKLTGRLSDMLRGLNNFHLRNLAEAFLVDEAFMGAFTTAPAGIKHHHAYQGGLLHHTVEMMELVEVIAPRYPELNIDVLKFGVFLHDIGKVAELHYDREFGYTDAGQLLGHVMLGVEMLTNKAADAEALAGEPIPDLILIELKHLILSHHGGYEYGSPKLPMTLEAVALHLIDTLDSQLKSYGGLIDDDVNTDSDWTIYHQNIGRKLYKRKTVEPVAVESLG
jgi:3'-5' exoribonuclease